MSVSFRFEIMQEIKRRLEEQMTVDENPVPVFSKVFSDEIRKEWSPADGDLLVFGDDATRRPVLGSQTQALLLNRNPSARSVDGMDLGPTNTKAGHSEFGLLVNWYVGPELVDTVETAQKAYDWLWYLQRFFSEERAKRNDKCGILGLGARAPCITGLEFNRGIVEPRDSNQTGWAGWLNVVLTLVEDFKTPYTAKQE